MPRSACCKRDCRCAGEPVTVPAQTRVPGSTIPMVASHQMTTCRSFLLCLPTSGKQVACAKQPSLASPAQAAPRIISASASSWLADTCQRPLECYQAPWQHCAVAESGYPAASHESSRLHQSPGISHHLIPAFAPSGRSKACVHLYDPVVSAGFVVVDLLDGALREGQIRRVVVGTHRAPYLRVDAVCDEKRRLQPVLQQHASCEAAAYILRDSFLMIVPTVELYCCIWTQMSSCSSKQSSPASSACQPCLMVLPAVTFL